MGTRFEKDKKHVEDWRWVAFLSGSWERCWRRILVKETHLFLVGLRNTHKARFLSCMVPKIFSLAAFAFMIFDAPLY